MLICVILRCEYVTANDAKHADRWVVHNKCEGEHIGSPLHNINNNVLFYILNKTHRKTVVAVEAVHAPFIRVEAEEPRALIGRSR